MKQFFIEENTKIEYVGDIDARSFDTMMDQVRKSLEYAQGHGLEVEVQYQIVGKHYTAIVIGRRVLRRLGCVEGIFA